MDIASDHVQAGSARGAVKEGESGRTRALVPSSEAPGSFFSVQCNPLLAPPISKPTVENQTADMSLASVEHSSSSMNGFFPSLPAVSSPSSLTNDTSPVGLGSSSPSVAHFSSYEASSTLSPASSSVSLAAPAISFASVSVTPASGASCTNASPLASCQPDSITPVTVAIKGSALNLPSSSARPLECPLSPPLGISTASEVATIAGDASSSFPPIVATKGNLSALLASTSVHRDNPSSTLLSSMGPTELLPPPPSSSPIEELSAPSFPHGAKLEMPTSCASLPSSATHSLVPAAHPASTGLLSDERSSLATPASFPTGLKVNALKRQRQLEGGEDFQNSVKKFRKECRAGNPKCGLETGKSILLGPYVSSVCDICCTEPGFCRECKCILCCKTIVPDSGECNLVRCLQRISDGSVCGHAAHLECALRSKMAGVVKMRGLDMEYLCRRCDRRTDLRELVTILLETIGNVELRTQAEKSLELVLEIMKGTAHGGSGARVLESLVLTALRKVQSGVDIQEVFSDLKDQGAAAESARHQNLARGVTLPEDVSQQPEASLDQWLPSSGSPSSHPSPGTPSSFASPILRSTPSVSSAQPSGTDYLDGSVSKHTLIEDNKDNFGQPQVSSRVYSNPKSKHYHLANKSLIRTGGQARVSHRIRVASLNEHNAHKSVCDSHTGRISGSHMSEPGSRDGNSTGWGIHNLDSGAKDSSDQRGPSAGAGAHKESSFFTEMCRSCGMMRRYSNGLEVSSSARLSKMDGGGKNNILQSSLRPRESEPSDNYEHVTGSDTGADGRGLTLSNFLDKTSDPKSLSSSLHLLDSLCEQDVQAVLQELRQSQDAEFECAKARLIAQKDSILREYKLLESACSEFAEQPVSSSLESFDKLMLKTATQFSKAKEERENFTTMLKVAKGFGSVPKDDLNRFYGWPRC